MMRRGNIWKSGFAWHAALIGIPLVCLVVFGLVSVRKDRELVMNEARDRAQLHSDQILSEITRVLSAGIEQSSGTSTNHGVGSIRFEISTNGALLNPPPEWPLVPTPIPRSKAEADARLAYAGAVSSIEGTKNVETAFPTLLALARDTNSLSEAGLPLAQLSLMTLLRHAGAARTNVISVALDSAVHVPTLLSVRILELARTAASESLAQSQVSAALVNWENDSRCRTLSQLVGPREAAFQTWIHVSEEWLAIGKGDGHGRMTVDCFRGSDLQKAVADAIHRLGSAAEYHRFRVSIGGREIPPRQNSEIAGATFITVGKAENGTIDVEASLRNLDSLLQRQRTRAAWMIALIMAVALTCVAGLVSSWRALSRQIELNEMKSNFVASVSHELRTPVASIRLIAEQLQSQREPAAEKRAEYYHFISQESQRLGTLVENLLDFSRIEGGRKRYDISEMDPIALIHGTIEIMLPMATERKIQLVANIADGIPGGIQADPQALQQALVNLIDNAIKHSPDGGKVEIGVSCLKSQAAAEPWIAFSIQDHGEGIPPEDHEKIFERFYRRHSELRRETQGVGIGLSIVKHVVEGHQGRLRVESAMGQGARFVIELPIKPVTS